MKSSNQKIDVSIIQKMIHDIKSSHDFNIVGKKITNAMTDYLGSVGAVLLLNKHEQKKLHAFYTSETRTVTKSIRLLRKDFTDHIYDYSKESENLFIKTVRENKSFESDVFSDFISPEVPYKIAFMISKLARVKRSISIPINFEEENLGVLFVAFPTPSINPDLYDTLLIFADYVAIAINNANQYENLQKEHKKMLAMYEIEQSSSNMLSHELKTPVAVLHNKVQMARAKIAQGLEEMQESLQKKQAKPKKKFWLNLFSAENIDTKANKAKQLFQEVYEIQNELELNIQKINSICDSIFQLREVENTPLHYNTLNARIIFENAIHIFQDRAKLKKLKFYYNIRLEQATFKGPILQLEQILSVLLDNAIKYTESGSIHVAIRQSQNKISLQVKDSGPGIPESEKELIFHRFSRGKNHKKHTDGLGLGLYIVKLLCDKIKAKISLFETKDQIGTVFKVEMKLDA